MRVLVLRAHGLGGLLTAVPALRALRHAFPEAHVQLACPQVLKPLALHTFAVDEVVGAAPLVRLPASVHHADLAVDLHGPGPESTALLRDTGAADLIAFGEGGPAWREDEHEVVRWCQLLVEHGIPADPTDLLLAPLHEVRSDETVVHPGAGRKSRRWPTERWVEVVAGLAGPVVVTAGPGETLLAEVIVRRAGAGRVVQPSLLELASLVGAAPLLISPDTGVAHLATALGTPSVTLFGPVPPALAGPPPDSPQHVPLWAGRVGDDLAPAVDPGLLELTPTDVLSAVAGLLSGAR